ncbi:PIN domain-containing protein [Marinihelvus fidelis]|uniref:PIN domain-containing protein n=1 Tax=Marinihelvus fidelis TaxID=2613842 RepID=A0A5N0THT6_9GAMM|nr:PIN domain-containing protein [Marinihelvus fidelis]KAA9134048.1 PIN domain-containing protein [Marinihelvus fidelis]
MILVNLNVIVDVLQVRHPFHSTSLGTLNRIMAGKRLAALASHSVTTLYFLMRKHSGREVANRSVDWAARRFEVIPVGQKELDRALALNWPGFEDAVVAAAAESAGCTHIVTRNVRDFRGSVVPAVLPDELVINEVHESFTRRYGSGGGASQAGGGSTR